MTSNEHEQYASEFRREIAERTRPYVERLQTFKNRPVVPVHSFVITAMTNLIDLIGYASDSTIDEYQNSIDPVIEGIDTIEEYTSCGYDNELFADPTSAEYRSYATEVAELMAIHENLTEWEIEFLRDQSDIITLVDDEEIDDLEAALVKMFDTQMTILENL